MKKIYFVLVLIFIVGANNLLSIPVDRNMADKVILTRLEVKDFKNKNNLVDITEILDEDGRSILAYIANLQPEGFIAISSDTDLTPIIAYSERGIFSFEDTVDNVVYRMIKMDMKNRLEAIEYLPEEYKKNNNDLWNEYLNNDQSLILRSNNRGSWPDPNVYPTWTGGWVKTTWTQGTKSNSTSYNGFCPNEPDSGRSVVGCVATAMSQVVNYFQWPPCVEFTDYDDYTSSEDNFTCIIDNNANVYNFPSFPQLNNYLQSIQYNTANDSVLANTATDDVKALCFGCGISIKMDYSAHSSATPTHKVDNSLLNKFNYSYADVQTRRPLEPGSFTLHLYDHLEQNMKDEKPAILNVTRPGNHGHAIVCDGYRDSPDESYHLNYGWSSNLPNPILDSWYSLPGNLPGPPGTGTEYDIIHYIVLDISKEFEIEVVVPTTSLQQNVGDFDNPNGFISVIRVYDDAEHEIKYLEKENFEIKIGGIDAEIVWAHYCPNWLGEGHYTLGIMPPEQASNGSYDYRVTITKRYLEATIVETDAIIYQGESNIDVVQVIDRSGSMANGFYEPGVYYLQTAKDAANLFVDQMEVGDMIGICSFESNATVDYYLREIESGGNQQQGAKNAINSLSASGGTTIGGGLQTGQGQFTQHGNTSHPWGMILLSDGDENSSPYVADVLPNIIPTQTKVYTISFGIYSNESLMQNIATETDGQYFNLPNPSTQDMLNVYNSIKGSIGNQQTFNIWEGVVQTGASTTENINIETGVTNAIFTVTWENASDDLYFELLDPGPDGISGTGDDIIIDPTYAANNPDIVTLTTGDTYKYYTFPSPNSGEWILTISNTLKSRDEIDFTATVTGESDVVINSFLGSDNYFINNPIKVVVTLADYATPIINADVNVAIEAPTVKNVKWSNSNAEYEKAGIYIGGSKSQNYRTDYMALYDDGLHGDGLADDGVYANIYTQTGIEGSYSFDIEATGVNTLGEPFSRFSMMSTYVNPPSYTGSISGEISYDGILSGNIYVELWANDPQMVTTPVIVITQNEPGNYLMGGLPDNINYYLNAYMDVNGNTSYDEGEPIGIYENNPIYIDSGQSITGVNVTILEMEIPTSVLQQGWNMVSVPCDPVPSDPVSLFGDDINPFYTNTYNSNIWWWSEVNSSYWIPDEIENGYGYWIRAWEDSTEIDAEGDLVTESVSFVLTNSADYYLMQHGFHMLGNPYVYPITFDDNSFDRGPGIQPWCAVWDHDIHNYEIHLYNDNFVIDPWKAYWIQTVVDNETITINPTTKGSSFFAGISGNNSTKVSKDNSNWEIKLIAEQDSLKDMSNWAGINETASDTWDSMDIPEIPPMTSEYISLFFPHDDWNQYSADYTRDVRSYDLGNPQWNFFVKSTESGEAKLTWNIPDEVPDEYTLQLIDLENNITTNIENVPEYVFNIIAQNEYEFTFTVVPFGVGPEPNIPTTFGLSANYPNPFTRSTEIHYQLPEIAQVDISIYNVKGQKIKVLENEQVEPGYYSIHWDGLDENGKKVRPGIYFYTIHAKGKSQEYKHCNKMLLIR